MYRYYRWWFFLNDAYEIPEASIGSVETFFKFCYEPEAECQVGRRCFKGVYDNIYYYNGHFETVKVYHDKHYENEPIFRLIRKISEGTVIEETYQAMELIAFNIFNFDEKYELKKHSIFNAEYQLQQFSEYFYDESGEISKEKYFFPLAWQIHIEEPNE